MKKIFGLALLAAITVSAHAATVFTTGATWKYVNATDATAFAGDTTGWAGPSYDDSAWFSGPTFFGNAYYNAEFGNPATQWDANKNPLVRKTVTLADDLDNATINLAIDNGFDLYVDGISVASDFQEGYTTRWEYSYNVGTLSAGSHTIALQLKDTGGYTAFDAELTGEPVPEPASMAVLGLGIAGAIRRRRNA